MWGQSNMANRRAQKRYVSYYGVDRNQEVSELHNGCNFWFLLVYRTLHYPVHTLFHGEDFF